MIAIESRESSCGSLNGALRSISAPRKYFKRILVPEVEIEALSIRMMGCIINMIST